MSTSTLTYTAEPAIEWNMLGSLGERRHASERTPSGGSPAPRERALPARKEEPVAEAPPRPGPVTDRRIVLDRIAHAMRDLDVIAHQATETRRELGVALALLEAMRDE